MADSFVIDLTSRAVGGILTISGYNNGPTDPTIYMQLKANSDFSLLPGEWLTSLIVPTGYAITDLSVSGILASGPNNLSDDSSVGLFTWQYVNNDIIDYQITNGTVLHNWNFGKEYENTRFNLHWFRSLNNSGIYSNNKTGIYTYPHNLQAAEVGLTMTPILGSTIRYNFNFPPVTNYGDALYTGSNLPYQVGFYYTNSRPSDIASGLINGTPYSFSSWPFVTGFASPSYTGMTIDLPLYDPRTLGSNSGIVPTSYNIYVGYRGAGGLQPTFLTIFSSQFDFLTKITPELDTQISTAIDSSKLQKVGDIEISANQGLIQRDRLTIGVKDIVVNANSYAQQGVYVSPYYTNENGIYTFTLSVQELIPNYPNIDPYSTVRYFVEFNGQGWTSISPTNRGTEALPDGTILPKMLIFDQDPGGTTAAIKYLNYVANATSFHIKIVFDTTMITGSFIPPEILDYKCTIFDKQQLLEL